MTDNPEARSERVKLVYNAQIDSPAGIILDYLLNNPHFTSRQGRQQAIDAIAAFYRPLAEEQRGARQQAELQEVARNCVEVLSKQIDVLCMRYQIEHPVNPPPSTASPESLDRLEHVLANGLHAIAHALQTGSVLPAAATAGEMPQPTINVGQGVRMEGNELGELGLLLEDEASFSDLAA